MRRIFTPTRSLGRARELRSSQTEAEKRLWGYLRGRRLQGWKFKRQVPLGPYYVDFFCERARLVIEVDGVTHGEDSEIAYDNARTKYLEALGYSVVRCYNAEVYENLNGVLDSILLKLEGR